MGWGRRKEKPKSSKEKYRRRSIVNKVSKERKQRSADSQSQKTVSVDSKQSLKPAEECDYCRRRRDVKNYVCEDNPCTSMGDSRPQSPEVDSKPHPKKRRSPHTSTRKHSKTRRNPKTEGTLPKTEGIPQSNTDTHPHSTMEGQPHSETESKTEDQQSTTHSTQSKTEEKPQSKSKRRSTFSKTKRKPEKEEKEKKKKRRCCSRNKKRRTPASSKESSREKLDKKDPSKHKTKDPSKHTTKDTTKDNQELQQLHPTIGDNLQVEQQHPSYRVNVEDQHPTYSDHLQLRREEERHERKCTHCQKRREEQAYCCDDNICKKIVDNSTQFDEQYIPQKYCKGQCVTCEDKNICHKKQCVVDTIEEITHYDQSTQYNSQANPPESQTSREDLLRPRSNEMCILECDINRKECCNMYSKAAQVTTMKLSKCKADKCRSRTNFGDTLSVQCDADSIVSDRDKNFNPRKITCKRPCIIEEDELIKTIECKIEEKVLSCMQTNKSCTSKFEDKDTQVCIIRECFCGLPKPEDKKQVTIQESGEQSKVTVKNSAMQTETETESPVVQKKSSCYNEVQVSSIDYCTSCPSNKSSNKSLKKDSETQMSKKSTPIKQTRSTAVQTSNENMTSCKSATEIATPLCSTTQTSKVNMNLNSCCKITIDGVEYMSKNLSKKELTSMSTQTANVAPKTMSSEILPIKNSKIQTSKHLMNETVNAGSIRIRPDQNPITIVLEYSKPCEHESCGLDMQSNNNKFIIKGEQKRNIDENQCVQKCCKCLPMTQSAKQFDVRTDYQQPEVQIAAAKSDMSHMMYVTPEQPQENMREPMLEQLPSENITKRNGLTPEGDRNPRKPSHDCILKNSSSIFRYVQQVPTPTCRPRMEESKSLPKLTTKEFIKLAASNPNCITYR